MEQQSTVPSDQSNGDSQPLVKELAVAFLVGAVAYLTTQITATLAIAGTLPFEVDELLTEAIGMVGFGIGVIAFLALYFAISRHDRSFLDIQPPNRRGIGYIIGGTILLIAVLIVVSMLFAQLDVETAEHGTIATAEENPELLLVMIPVSLFIIGPGEELLFRNIVQKRLYTVFEKSQAVIVASVLFAAIHLPAYYLTAAGSTELLTSLSVIFVLSILLGGIYAITENIVIPAAVHGLYNAFVFGQAYLDQVGMVL